MELIDVLIGGGIAATVIYSAATYQPKEARKINNVFRNVNYRVGKLSPRLRETRREVLYTEYIYEVPSGLIDDHNLEEILTKTLRKPVSIKFKGVLILRVYNDAIPSEIKYDWKTTERWAFPIGHNLDGVLYHDFDKIPHMTIAGATRQGKTVLLKLILAHLINSQPENAEIYILDLKGGLEFGKYRRLRQIKSIADNVRSAELVLQSILNRLADDMSRYARNGHSDVIEANEKRRIFVITDEAAELADSKKCLDS